MSFSFSPVKSESKVVEEKKRRMPLWLEYALPFIIFALLAFLIFWVFNLINSSGSGDAVPTELATDPDSNATIGEDTLNIQDRYSKEDRDESFYGDDDPDPSVDSGQINKGTVNDPIANHLADSVLKDTPAKDDVGSDPDESENTFESKETAEESAGYSPEWTGKGAILEGTHPPSRFDKIDIQGEEIQPFHPAPGVCVIVVGSFKRSKNVNRMIEKLRSKGLEHFTQGYRGFTRVGIVLTCQTELDVYKRLDQIKKEVEKEAWLLN